MNNFNFILDSTYTQVELTKLINHLPVGEKIVLTKSRQSSVTKVQASTGQFWLFDVNNRLFFSAERLKNTRKIVWYPQRYINSSPRQCMVGILEEDRMGALDIITDNKQYSDLLCFDGVPDDKINRFCLDKNIPFLDVRVNSFTELPEIVCYLEQDPLGYLTKYVGDFVWYDEIIETEISEYNKIETIRIKSETGVFDHVEFTWYDDRLEIQRDWYDEEPETTQFYYNGKGLLEKAVRRSTKREIVTIFNYSDLSYTADPFHENYYKGLKPPGNSVRYYCVFEGREVGIYDQWAEAEKMVKGFSKAKYKGYESYGEAERALKAYLGLTVNSTQK